MRRLKAYLIYLVSEADHICLEMGSQVPSHVHLGLLGKISFFSVESSGRKVRSRLSATTLALLFITFIAS